jgi:hypothetical protein
MFLVERRISLSWIVRGQTGRSMSLQSLPGPASGSPRSLTIGSDGWLLDTIALRNSFLAGPSTDRARVARLPPPTNFLTLLSLGLEIQIHGSERRGRRAKDWQNSSRIVEPWLFWMAWSHSKIHLVRSKGGCVSLPSRRFCGNSLPSIRGLALSLRGRRLPILQITSAPQLFVVTWNNYPAMPVRNCSERWASREMRRNSEVPATSSAAIVWR